MGLLLGGGASSGGGKGWPPLGRTASRGRCQPTDRRLIGSFRPEAGWRDDARLAFAGLAAIVAAPSVQCGAGGYRRGTTCPMRTGEAVPPRVTNMRRFEQFLRRLVHFQGTRPF